MKSSLDKIRDILHLYLGCQVCREHKDERSDKFFEYAKMVGISQSEIEPEKSVAILDVGLDHFHEWYVEETKPILRQLSSMTEEEAKEYKLMQTEFLVHAPCQNTPVHLDSPESFRWLLSKGFDLFNLIPEGLAIDADTLKTTSNGRA